MNARTWWSRIERTLPVREWANIRELLGVGREGNAMEERRRPPGPPRSRRTTAERSAEREPADGKPASRVASKVAAKVGSKVAKKGESESADGASTSKRAKKGEGQSESADGNAASRVASKVASKVGSKVSRKGDGKEADGRPVPKVAKVAKKRQAGPADRASAVRRRANAGGRGEIDEPEPKLGRRHLVAALVVSVLFVGVLFITVFPTRTYLSQRSATNQAERRLDALDREARRLERDTARLRTPAEIERLAREKYLLVRPGEEAYAILPRPWAPIGLPPIWPFAGVEQALSG